MDAAKIETIQLQGILLLMMNDSGEDFALQVSGQVGLCLPAFRGNVEAITGSNYLSRKRKKNPVELPSPLAHWLLCQITPRINEYDNSLRSGWD